MILFGQVNKSKRGEIMSEICVAPQFTFKRIEKKWKMTPEQFKELLPCLAEHLTRDVYGTSTVISEFYDTKDFLLIRNSIERPLFKEKLRIRSYGVPTENSNVFVEIKRKLNGIGYKRRIYVPYSDAKKLLSGQEIQCDNPQIEKEILEFVKRYNPIPVATVAYERTALYGKNDKNLRVTIDRHIRFRTNETSLLNGDFGSPVLEDYESVLMEVKVQGGIPIWLDKELSRLKIYRAPFSKIGTAYTNKIASTAIYK